jgi:hypothetical protein
MFRPVPPPPHCSVYIYIYDTLQGPGVSSPGLFADDTCILMYATYRKEGYVLRNLQRGLSAIETWCDCWTIKSMKIRLRPSTFLIDLGPLRLILH